MNYWKKVPLAVSCSVIFPLVLVIISKTLISCILLAFWLGAVLFYLFKTVDKQLEEQRHQTQQRMEDTAISVLNHHRHDWMNDLQVLYGYIRLGKNDKSIQTVERIKERMTEESKISKLGVPSLIFYLQSYRISGSPVVLSVEVEDGLRLDTLISPEDGEMLTGTIADTVRAYQFSNRSSWGEIRHLLIRFGQDQGDVIVRFEGERIASESEAWSNLYTMKQGTKVIAEPPATGDALIQFRVTCGI
ncbi:Spo0B domain-containing protein [Paenibacillus shunpengii]|uniref:Spo0B domain-containing protein n=1 Tax=Paenibacillus shunpengii TaxID=2054424 RepID=A0ABW5STT1_9BACL|nr:MULTISPECIES: Spo0B domain-containing protein [unclassified Paenibacillus]OMC64952.1 sporulation protein [Paenibacillus sp. FSL H7-0326]SDX53120.1 Sensor_kinase_SpoOB-type, alpha-helical domain [Paenibacillus sp. PDC88]